MNLTGLASQSITSAGDSILGVVAPCPIVPHSPIGDVIVRFLFVTSLNARPATVKYYEQYLRPLLDLDKPVGAITIEDLQWLYAQLKSRQTRFATHPTRPALPSGLSTFTLHKFIRSWKRFFNWLIETSVLQCNPAEKLKRPKLPDRAPKDMTPEDLELILKASRGNERDYALICFLADTACRVGGVATLRMDNLHLIQGYAVVREKGDHDREVTFGSRTRAALEQYISGERVETQGRLVDKGIQFDPWIVFLGKKGGLTPGGVYQILKRLARRAGVKGKFNPHSLRHGWVRGALSRGANLEQIRRYLGHKQISTTATHYAVYLDEELREQHGQLSWLRSELSED